MTEAGESCRPRRRDRWLPQDERPLAVSMALALFAVLTLRAYLSAVMSPLLPQPVGVGMQDVLQRFLLEAGFAGLVGFLPVSVVLLVPRVPRGVWLATAAYLLVPLAGILVSILMTQSRSSLPDLPENAWRAAQYPLLGGLGAPAAVLLFAGVGSWLEKRREEAQREPGEPKPEADHYAEWDQVDKRTHDAFSWSSLLPAGQRPLVFAFIAVLAAREFVSTLGSAPLEYFWLREGIPLGGKQEALFQAVRVSLLAVSLLVGLLVAYRYLRSPVSVWLLFLVPLAVELASTGAFPVQLLVSGQGRLFGSMPLPPLGLVALSLGVGVLAAGVPILLALFARDRWVCRSDEPHPDEPTAA